MHREGKTLLFVVRKRKTILKERIRIREERENKEAEKITLINIFGNNLIK